MCRCLWQTATSATFVTRNVRHFQVVKDEITVLTPEEFLAGMVRKEDKQWQQS